MDQESIFKLKKRFQSAFPEEAKLLELAKSQDEIDELQKRFIDDVKQKLAEQIKDSKLSIETSHIASDITELGPVILTSERYESLIDAEGGEIENKIHVLLDGLERLSKMKNERDVGLVVATAFTVGILAAAMIVRALFRVGPSIEYTLIETIVIFTDYWTTFGAVMYAAITLIVYIILIPILYYMDKPANCVVILINELDKDIELVNHYNTHGNMKSKTSTIPAINATVEGKRIPAAGFFSSVKTKSALVGTQFGFSMKTSDGVNFAFAAENPLTGLYVLNNCWCDFDISAKEASKLTDSENKIFKQVSKNGITISIRVNSKHGGTSYYVARVYKTPQ